MKTDHYLGALRRGRSAEDPPLCLLAPLSGVTDLHMRRIALRCEKTITAFMGFVHLACAMIWLR